MNELFFIIKRKGNSIKKFIYINLLNIIIIGGFGGCKILADDELKYPMCMRLTWVYNDLLTRDTVLVAYSAYPPTEQRKNWIILPEIGGFLYPDRAEIINGGCDEKGDCGNCIMR